VLAFCLELTVSPRIGTAKIENNAIGGPWKPSVARFAQLQGIDEFLAARRQQVIALLWIWGQAGHAVVSLVVEGVQNATVCARYQFLAASARRVESRWLVYVAANFFAEPVPRMAPVFPRRRSPR